jgi:8-amino-7-oxononanoate synthase
MDGDRAPINDLLSLAERYGAEVIVDEAHATGVLGSQGRGLVAEAQATDRVLAIVHTCGKALASTGAFVAGSKVLKQFLINHARPFIFSTALPPYMAAQIRAALQLARAADWERARLEELASCLRDGLRVQGFDFGRCHSQIVPVIVGENETALSLAACLRAEGFAVRAIRPPTVPAGTARLRLSLTVKHTADILSSLVDSLVRARKEVQLARSHSG